MTDAELIAASLDDPPRFAELFDRHFAAVFRFAERRVGHDQAGEVASETFTRAFARRVAYRADAVDALPWLYGIASNLVLHERRRFARYLSAIERVGTEVSRQERDGGLAAADRQLGAHARLGADARGAARPRATPTASCCCSSPGTSSHTRTQPQCSTCRSAPSAPSCPATKARLRELLEATGRTAPDWGPLRRRRRI